MSATSHYDVLMSTVPASAPGRDSELELAELDHAAAPWEKSLQATCECLSWRGALDSLERRRAEDALGATLYAGFPVHTRSAVVTAHMLIDAGAISEDELEAKMASVRARFERR